MTDSGSEPKTINRLFDAVYPSFAMLAGMELDLFTQLKDGPRDVEQLAGAIGVQALKLRPLLYALVVAGLLVVEDGSFANTAEAEKYLVAGKPSFLGQTHRLVANNWLRILDMASTIRAGGPLEMYDYHAESHEEMVALFQGLYPGAVKDAHRLMDHFDLPAQGPLLDVGGGSGGLAITLAEAKPLLRTTVVDLPSVTPITRLFVDQVDAGDRVKIVTADIVKSRPPGSFDVIVARHLIQVLSEQDSGAVLKNLFTILNPGGALFLIGWVLDDSRLSPAEMVNLNLVLLNGYQDGQAYTEGEYRQWLDEVGFVGFERLVFPDGASIISVQKPPF